MQSVTCLPSSSILRMAPTHHAADHRRRRKNRVGSQPGTSETIRSTPVVADIDDDGDVEIIVSKDTNSGLDVQAWSPELECDASGWVRTGHSNERLWTWSDADYSLSAPSPHLPSSQSGHRAVTQPLLADVDLDGAPDLVLAVDRRSHRRPHPCWTPAERRNAWCTALGGGA